MSTRRSDKRTHPCHAAAHVFDKTDVLDRWFDPTQPSDQSWVPCVEQPCSYRENRPLGHSTDSWAIEISPSQLKLFTAHLTASSVSTPPSTITSSSRIMPSTVDAIHKAFGSVPALKADGTNYRTWFQRATFAALGCAVKDLLTETKIPEDKNVVG